ncbi:MAG: CPBP family intramembrane metalloprotease [Phycisphaerales bacterium]|nr:CPBP family intramembrane metalloprotease [Phycisphaerales bacterium]
MFLAPFILVYEIGLLGVLRSGNGLVLTNLAHKSIAEFFERMGVLGWGVALPGIVLVVLLIVWHVIKRRPWRVDYGAVGLMWLESMLLMIPLYVLARVITNAPALDVTSEADAGMAMGLMAQVVMGIGAGLYEELIFRWLMIALIHTIACDLLRASNRVGLGFAVVISALAFTAYHPLDGAGTGAVVFYLVGGLYFGLLFVVRGFGIVAAVHALYDIAAVLGKA